MYKGRIQEKNGVFYVVINFIDENGKRKEPWFNTKLKKKGNKKEALKLLEIACNNFNPKLLDYYKSNAINIFDENSSGEIARQIMITSDKEIISPKILFGDFMELWVDSVKDSVEKNTYDGYCSKIRRIKEYFNSRGITLENLHEDDIEDFYAIETKRTSANNVKHYHANINKALNYARKKRLIVTNVLDFVEKPKIEEYIANYYNAEQLLELFDKIKGETIELPVLIAGYYGLRRSEVVGLKWSNIDFFNKTIKIKHTVVMSTVDGKYQIVKRDRAKTRSSIRTLPLFKRVEDKLNLLKNEIEENKKFFGNSYNFDFEDYICVLPNGNLIRPDYITGKFNFILKKKGMPHIRFHDLRHSCAALQRREGVELADISEWLGHSNVLVTQKIYAHFENVKHLKTAEIIAKQLAK